MGRASVRLLIVVSDLRHLEKVRLPKPRFGAVFKTPS